LVWVIVSGGAGSDDGFKPKADAQAPISMKMKVIREISVKEKYSLLNPPPFLKPRPILL